jgi:RNA polymerase sigma-70 factor (ECF subfamily)
MRGGKKSMGTVSLDSVPHVQHNMLVERFQSGEMGAFDEIVDKCQKNVYNLAYRFTRNCEDAYDISQEVFIKVFKSLGRLKNSSAFDAWLRRVTVNACMDHLRQRPNERIMDDLSHLDGEHNVSAGYLLPDVPVEDSEMLQIIARAVDQLPKRQRKVFVLRHYEGLSLKEIAAALGCSIGTVKAHLFRATRRLRKLLLPYVSQIS